jgi:hypothetical protein
MYWLYFTGIAYPKSIIRLCREVSRFRTVLNKAIKTPEKEWDQRLKEETSEIVLGRNFEKEISVYGTDTSEVFDYRRECVNI